MRNLLLLAFFYFPFIFFSSCHSSEHRAVSGDWLSIGYEVPIGTLSFSSSSGISGNLKEFIFEGLLSLSPSGYENRLAVAWHAENTGKQYRVFLKPEVYFHDGRMLTVEDVVFSYKYYKSTGRHDLAFLLQDLTELKIIGPTEILFHLKRPLSSFPLALTMEIFPAFAHPISNVAWQNYDTQIGTGPFRIGKSTKDSLSLPANRQYHGTGPYLNGIKIFSYSSTTAVWSRLVAGKLDLATEITNKNLEKMKGIPNLTVRSYRAPYAHLILIHPRLVSRRVVHALNYAVDRRQLIDRALAGAGEAMQSLILPESWAYEPVFNTSYDPKIALELLKQEGYSRRNKEGLLVGQNGKPLQLTCLVPEGDGVLLEVARLLRQQLFQIGVDFLIQTAPIEELVKKVQHTYRYEAGYFYGYAPPDPDYMSYWWETYFKPYPFFTASMARLRQARGALNIEDRKRLYNKVMQLLVQDPPGLFLFWRHRALAFNARFKGVEINPFRLFDSAHQWYVPKHEQKYHTEPSLD